MDDPISLWGKMPEVPKQKIENMSIFLASWMYLMVIIDGSSFLTASNALAVLGITSMGPFNRVFKMPIKSKKLMKFHDVDEIP